MNNARKEALEDAARTCRKIAAGNYQVAAGDLPWWQSEESKNVWRVAAEKCSEAILALVRDLAHEKIVVEETADGQSESAQLQCGEQGCERAASHRYRWPGGSDAVVCSKCVGYVRDKAGQMKLGVGRAFEFTPLTPVVSSIVAEALAVPVLEPLPPKFAPTPPPIKSTCTAEGTIEELAPNMTLIVNGEERSLPAQILAGDVLETRSS